MEKVRNEFRIIIFYYLFFSNSFSIKLLISISIFLLFITGCKDGITNPVNGNKGVLCYEKSVSGYWEIFTNNLSGSNPQNISNYSDNDEYPQWSPDGRYIVYSRSQPIGGHLIIVYDTKTQTSKDISDGGEASLQPRWTPNGKVFFGYPHPWSKYQGTYIMNPDGSERKKILGTTGAIYFYNDSYTFLYITDSKVYKTNTDNTFTELVLELPSPSSNEFITIRDFNPLTDDFLVNTNTIPGSASAIATYNTNSKQLNLLITAEDDYVLFLQKYSKDFSKIAFIEHSSNDEYLSVFENGDKKRLVRIAASTPSVYFSYQPMEFSPDGKYIAFSKQIFHSGDWVVFSTPLLIVDINDETVRQLEDEAHYPSWNPQP